MAITDYGLKWAKPNADVSTAGLGDTLIISSKPILKYLVVDIDSINIDTDGTEYDVLVYTHDLGYEPQYEFLTQWIDVEDGTKKSTYMGAPVYNGIYASTGIYMDIRPYMTTTEFRLFISIFDSLDNNHDINYIYKIYYDPDEDL